MTTTTGADPLWRRIRRAVLQFLRVRKDHDALADAVRLFALNQQQQTKLLGEMQRRLTHHEQGPLLLSRRELDHRGGGLVPHLIEVKGNGGKSKASKRIDVHGKVDSGEGPEEG